MTRTTMATRVVSLCPVGDRRRLSIGRSQDNDLVVSDESVSGTHAVLHLDEQGDKLEDLGSSNGTFIDGTRLEHGKRYPIRFEQQFTLGLANAVLHRSDDGRVAITSETISPIRAIPVNQRRVIVTVLPADAPSREKRGVLGGLLAAVGALGSVALRRFIRRLMSARLTPAIVAIERAKAELVFPKGHPLAGSAYVVHPHDDGRYLCVESFHQALFNEKRSELLTILAALGAKRVTLRCVAGSGLQVGGRAVVPGVEPLGEVGGKVRVFSEREGEGVFEEHYGPIGTPRLPDDLIWYHYEPDWRGWAERCLSYGLESFTCSLKYTESFGVDSTLAANLKKIGVELGADFHKFQESVWEVTFVG